MDDDDGEVSLDDDFEGENFEDESGEDGEKHNQSDFVFNFGESKVVKPTKLEAFNKVLEETEKLVVVLFGETWNMQCAQMMNTLDTYSNQYTDVTFVYVNIEEYKPAEANDSTSYPSFRVVHKKKVLSLFEGSDENKLKGEIERWNETVKSGSSGTTTATTSSESSASVINEKEEETKIEVSNVTNYENLSQVEPFCVLPGSPNKHCFLVQQKEVVNSKLVLKEFTFFKNSLPKGVFVRVFEARLDILRVLIFPPQNSPLSFSPFIFDGKILFFFLIFF